ncbi:hypothetical protein AMS68_001541 [Peltaster fructicola]|uniref:tyrosinase n=1 Tax=Peltaster fructicola TaxID=286661 RepID=A0A6H0XMS2_9PEZI|nr:hypothetical protein AMS68_001541 [Peltaster fructicola]
MAPQVCTARHRLTAVALTLLTLSSLSIASPTLLRHEVRILPEMLPNELQKRQDSGPYTAVTGIIGNGSHPRLEIRQLQQNTDQWNLFILGLDRFMKADETQKLSYYQIAGIHGRPYVPWDNVGPFVGNTQGPGYCTHVSNIFLTWHRPYMALYEQALYSHILAVVNTFPQGEQRSRYSRAAATWRHPYWDWATPPSDGGSVYPTSVSSPTVQVTLPNGTATIANPLYAFDFHPVSVSDFYYNPFATWPETKRYPTNWTYQAVSQNNLVAAVMDNNRQSIQQRLYNLFTNYDNFTQFSNEAWYFGNTASSADSLESIHDVVHAITGQSGHMTYLDYSAFDPLFWLHHAMIDRLFAMFQVLHPDSYVEPMDAIEQTFTIAPHQNISIDTPLDPFHSNSAGAKYTSQTVRSITSFGYTYPELTGNASAASVRAAINNLYGTSAGSKVLTGRSAQADNELVERASTVMQLSNLPGETTEEGKRKQYILNLQSEKFAANGSYAIYVFLGYFNEDEPSTWALAPNLVGTHGVFTALPSDDAASGLTRRMAMSSVLVTGTIPLTSALLERVQGGELSSMHDTDVEDYLAENLHWRAALFDNTELPLSEVSGLDIKVVRANVMPAKTHDAFPSWGDFIQLKRITTRSASCSAW